MVGAKHMEKSTDVPGMLTADPRLVPSARIIESMSYEEAMELCHFGAKVIYPPTLLPLRETGIPLVIRSTFDPSSAGTTISANPNPGGGVRGVSSIDGMALLTLVGSGMVGIPGYSRRLFMALSMRQVNVVLITQGSSEHSITVAVQDIHIDLALEALQDEFESDLAVGKVEPFRVETGLSILALVGTPCIITQAFQDELLMLWVKMESTFLPLPRDRRNATSASSFATKMWPKHFAHCTVPCLSVKYAGFICFAWAWGM